MNGDQLKKIDKYLMKQMSSEELALFEEQMSNDDSLRREVELSKEINHYLSDEKLSSKIPNNEFVNKTRAFIKSDEAKQFKTKILKIGDRKTIPKSSKRSNFLIAASIAAFIALVSSFFFFNESDSQKLYAEFYNENDLPTFMKRGGVVSVLKDGEVAFLDKDYKKAILLFTTYLDETENPDPNVFIFRGVSNMMTNHFDNAISDFDKMINSNHIDNIRGRWFKALAFLKMNDTVRAKISLEKITENSSNFKYNEVLELLERLD